MNGAQYADRIEELSSGIEQVKLIEGDHSRHPTPKEERLSKHKESGDSIQPAEAAHDFSALVQKFNSIESQWNKTACSGILRRVLDDVVRKATTNVQCGDGGSTLDRIVCLGLGSLSSGDSWWRGDSMWQLVVLTSVREHFHVRSSGRS